MDVVKHIKDNTLLIIPNNLKEKVLLELDTIDKITSIKIMDMDEVKKHLFFDYDIDSFVYLKNKYGLNLDTCKTYLKNMYFLPDTFTSSDKLNELIMIKNTMLENNLLKKDDLFTKYLKNKHIIIYGYDYYDKFSLKIIELLKNITTVTVFHKIESPKKDLKAFEFNSITDEVLYITEEIYKLLKNGVSIDRIKLANVDNDYVKEIRRVFSMYKIPVNLNEKISLYNIKFGKTVLDLLNQNKNFNEIIESLTDKFDNSLINKLIVIFNKYVNYSSDILKIIDLIEDDLKHTYLDKSNNKKSIEIIDIYNNEIDDDNYVFLMGFNNKLIPRTCKDEDFISDKLKTELDLSTSIEINELINKSTINILNTINNLVITYKLRTPFMEFIPSTLIEDYNIEVIKPDDIISSNKEYNELKLGMMLDNLIKYGKHDENLDLLYSNTSFKYLTYDNKYKGINNDELHKFLNNKLTLSYSSLDNFYHCKFRYYLSNILKISIFEESLSTKIGNLFHYILSLKDTKDFDLDKIYEEEINKLKENNLTKKEEFYLRRLKKELESIVKVLKHHKSITGLTNEEYETKFLIKKQYQDLEVNFIGFVDKILSTYKDNQELIAIIDYKTGNMDINLTYLPLGLKMQLPIYLYLVKNTEKYKNAKVCGIYIQNILNNIKGDKKGIDQEYLEALRLNGYSTDDISRLEVFDGTYEKSEMIKGMSLTKDGNFSRYAKTLTDEEINKILEITESKITDSIKDIYNGDFTINPKRLDNDLIGCNYCEFKDICFRKEEDIIDIEKESDLDFLKDEEN